MEIEDEMFLDDDQDILDIIDYGFPRRRYERADYFHDMDDKSPIRLLIFQNRGVFVCYQVY